jgi:glutamyl-tRNA synthetase
MFRVRFAPSPTGYLHIGGARTALFNWLLARRHGGVFVLRIEDTDAERSSAEMVEGILDGMRWLGLEWDEGPGIGGPHEPYFQSARLDRYRALVDRLLSSGDAYYCYCTPEELKAKREMAAGDRGAGAPGKDNVWRYDRTCCALTPAAIAARETEQRPRAVRIKVPEGEIAFTDRVHGPISFHGANIEDFVILRSDGHPTYQLSVVADDIDMGITHVVRGDDHISNTPKQILIYRAAGAPIPEFAHVPLILGPDKKRLSKRHGATSVMEYARQGYLPEAMVNFLTLLGWSPGAGDQEMFTRQELIDTFALEGISGGNAVFNPEKLEWFNQQYIMRLAPDDLAERVRPSFVAAGIWRDELLGDRHAWFYSMLELFRPRAKRLDDIAEQARFFFVDTIDIDPAAADKHLRAAGLADHLLALDAAFASAATFDAQTLESILRDTAESRRVKAATLIHAVRVAVTGKSVSPGIFDLLALLGREPVHIRLEAAARESSRVAS